LPDEQIPQKPPEYDGEIPDSSEQITRLTRIDCRSSGAG
jgi:hypothetical protein